MGSGRFVFQINFKKIKKIYSGINLKKLIFFIFTLFLVNFIANFVFYVIILIGLIFAFTKMGFNISTFLVILGSGGVGGAGCGGGTPGSTRNSSRRRLRA